MIIVNEREVNTMKDIMLTQLQENEKFEIDNLTDNTITVWHKDDQQFFTFEFDNNGKLVDIY
jgi:hypothetical protein